jgi:serine protease DegQ
MVVLLLSVVCAALVWQVTQRGPRVLTQKDIDAAVLSTLQNNVLPSQAAAAYENVRPSIVRVVSFVKKSRLEDMKASKQAKTAPLAKKPPLQDKSAKKPGLEDEKIAKNERLAPDIKAEDDEVEFGVGTGVVIVDKGIILTNWHVVQGADRIKITFMDGLEAEADIKGVQAEDDLAVLQARKIPDDLIAATMRSTADLREGDQVIAVGFPFGIGPSTSAGIVSGLKRSFRSPDGGQTMKNLIQFDAAANPGNSGGPLVTMDGEVVGIVTAIMNPTPARTFIGIGFAVPIENAASAAGMPPF